MLFGSRLRSGCTAGGCTDPGSALLRIVALDTLEAPPAARARHQGGIFSLERRRTMQRPSCGNFKLQFSKDFRNECSPNGSKTEQTASRTMMGYPHEGPREVRPRWIGRRCDWVNRAGFVPGVDYCGQGLCQENLRRVSISQPQRARYHGGEFVGAENQASLNST